MKLRNDVCRKNKSMFTAEANALMRCGETTTARSSLGAQPSRYAASYHSLAADYVKLMSHVNLASL